MPDLRAYAGVFAPPGSALGGAKLLRVTGWQSPQHLHQILGKRLQ